MHKSVTKDYLKTRNTCIITFAQRYHIRKKRIKCQASKCITAVLYEYVITYYINKLKKKTSITFPFILLDEERVTLIIITINYSVT